MTIAVNGQQYVWRYQYPGKDRLLAYTDMVVPVGMTVMLDITADDVVHSWWIPKLGGKMDAVPGYTNKTWFQIPPDAIPEGQKQVVFTGQCAELCGRNHANMYGRVIGMRMADYKKWYADKVAAGQDGQDRRRRAAEGAHRADQASRQTDEDRRQPRLSPPAPAYGGRARRSSPTAPTRRQRAAGPRGSPRPITRRSGSCTSPRCWCSSCWAGSRRC